MRGVGPGLASGAGAATTHGLYATLAVFGAHVSAGPFAGFQTQFHYFSGIVFVLLGIWTLFRHPSARDNKTSTTGGLGPFLAGAGLALANPMTLLPYLAFAGSPRADRSDRQPLPRPDRLRCGPRHALLVLDDERIRVALAPAPPAPASHAPPPRCGAGLDRDGHRDGTAVALLPSRCMACPPARHRPQAYRIRTIASTLNAFRNCGGGGSS